MHWRLLLLAVIVIPASPRALPCSCAGVSVEVARKNAALVFVGRVTARQIPDIDVSDARALLRAGLDLTAKVSFDVLQAWSYDAPRIVEAITPMSGASCGYLPDPGTTHIIFAHRRKPHDPLEIHLCSRNAPIENANDILERLGPPVVRYHQLQPGAAATHGAWPLYRLGRRVKSPSPISRPEPEVVANAPCRGLVVLRLIIDATGTVVEVEDLSRPPDAFTRARADAALEWTFRSATLDGNPVAVEMYSHIHLRCPSRGR
jgi:hypothetical protein